MGGLPINSPTERVGCFMVDARLGACFAECGSVQASTAKQERRRAGRGNSDRGDAMSAQQLLQEISDYCRHSGLAESTFGRRAVNDGKLTARLRNGGRITTETLDRIRAFMHTNKK